MISCSLNYCSSDELSHCFRLMKMLRYVINELFTYYPIFKGKLQEEYLSWKIKRLGDLEFLLLLQTLRLLGCWWGVIAVKLCFKIWLWSTLPSQSQECHFCHLHRLALAQILCFVQRNMTQRNVFRIHFSIPNAIRTEEIQPAEETDCLAEAKG